MNYQDTPRNSQASRPAWCRLVGRTSGFAMMALLTSTSALAQQTTLTETGSSLLYPMLTTWVAQYSKAHPEVHINTSATGSEAGIEQVIANKVNLGASDAYMSDAQISEHPGIINVPLAIAAQTINYNVPGLNRAHLKLDGPTLAGIYSGTVRSWNAPEIVALNPGVSLPNHLIVPVRRSEGSGDTFVFTQFLTFSTPSWESEHGYGTTITWPSLPGSVTAAGNDGMVKAIQSNDYSIGYVGLSYSDSIAQAKLGTAALKNQAGEFVLPTEATIMTGAASLGARTPGDERLTLIYAPASGAYPLVNYEYAVVSNQQSDPATAAAIRRFLLWTILPSEENAGWLTTAHFIPLPAHIWELSQAQIQSIK
jgi:phosphate transport system substrate-binding protein